MFCGGRKGDRLRGRMHGNKSRLIESRHKDFVARDLSWMIKVGKQRSYLLALSTSLYRDIFHKFPSIDIEDT